MLNSSKKFHLGQLKICLTVFWMFYSCFVWTQCCTYSLTMQDSYGDGWNSGYLRVFVNNTFAGSFYAKESGSVDTFRVCDGNKVELFYTAGDYENENTYQLYDPAWNLIFSDGPEPKKGKIYSGTPGCNVVPQQGSHPCTSIPLSLGLTGVSASNTGYEFSGIRPAGCGFDSGSDVWFNVQVPPSGNLQFMTKSSGANSAGVAIYEGNMCGITRLLACESTANDQNEAVINLYDLKELQTLYIQVWGANGEETNFMQTVRDLGKIVLQNSELPIVMIHTEGQNIGYDTKINASMVIKYNGEGAVTDINDGNDVYNGPVGIEIRGASSAGYPQSPYSFETRDEAGQNKNVSILGMPEENDWTLISNFNDRSLVRNSLPLKLFEEMNNYSVRSSLCEVLINGRYKGIYLLTEKIKRDQNRVNVSKLTTEDVSGDDLTGGYILQQNLRAENNSFQSNFSPLDFPGADVHFLYEYPAADIINPAQKTYIASYVDSLERALYSPQFADPKKGYRNFLDVKSFIDYLLINELARNADGFKKSIFYNKDKFSKGNKLKAGPVWDFDWAWKNLDICDLYNKSDGSGWAHHNNECPTDNYSSAWYLRMLQDSTFSQELKCAYLAYRKTILDTSHIFTYIDSVSHVVRNANMRHFDRWRVLGKSGPAPEIGTVANTYTAELDTLKSWIRTRLIWMDKNMPGKCNLISSAYENPNTESRVKCYPNPSNGRVRFEGITQNDGNLRIEIYDVAGRNIKTLKILQNDTSLEYTLPISGVYYYTLKGKAGNLQHGKIIVL